MLMKLNYRYKFLQKYVNFKKSLPNVRINKYNNAASCIVIYLATFYFRDQIAKTSLVYETKN